MTDEIKKLEEALNEPNAKEDTKIPEPDMILAMWPENIGEAIQDYLIKENLIPEGYELDNMVAPLNLTKEGKFIVGLYLRVSSRDIDSGDAPPNRTLN
jgi:hypothetical protein